jgi:Reverse transcriptase (RNA-dependent DNA polymerase)
MHLKKGNTGFMTIKVDLEEAYDKLRWSFVRDTICAIGIPMRLVEIIMDCISSVSMRVLWNGNMTEEFQPQRGLRQGDPMSPYIFLLCIERLSQRIETLVYIKGMEATLF